MPASPAFLVDGILPAYEVHLLGGSSGSGKTTFSFQVFLAEWQQGNAVFGHESHPVPYVYVSMDRSRSSVTRTLERLGLTEAITRLVCQEDIAEASVTVDEVVRDAMKIYPDSRLIVIEGFQLLVGERGNGYTSVARMLKKAARICTKHKLTIIGVCHSPKMKIDESFQHPREMLLGSVSWGAYSDTIITLSLDENTGIISVHVMPRNAASEKHEMRFGENGILEHVIHKNKKHSMCVKIAALAAGRPVTRTEILSWGTSLKISSRTCEAAIQICLENKILESLDAGIYERSDSPLPTLGQESDIIVDE
jgi:RecA-family ATPase